MSTRDALLAVRKVVAHADCPDGVASALICHDALPLSRVVFAQHGSSALRDLPAEPGMLFVDIVPPRERVSEFVDAGAFVLDHHKGAADIAQAFGERGVFADESAQPGVSGALLAFEHVWQPVTGERGSTIRAFAELAGVRDTWQRHDSRWASACEQAAALRFWPAETLLDRGLVGLGPMLAIGPVLIQKDLERDARSIAEAHRFTSRGVRVVAFEGGWTSDIAEKLSGEADFVLGWHYFVDSGRRRLVVSCRSRGDFSALDFAKANGGGGHTRAAGFTIDSPLQDPYTALEILVGAFIAGGES